MKVEEYRREICMDCSTLVDCQGSNIEECMRADDEWQED